MSIQVDCGSIRSAQGRSFNVQAHICEEFPTQVEYVTVSSGLISIFEGKPSDAKSAFEHEAVAHAQAIAANNLEWDKGCDEVIEDL
jgi:hypothetical protein